MNKNEIMHMIDRSLFASLGYIGTDGQPNIRRVFCVWHKGLGAHLISTNTASEHVTALLQSGRACLYFSDDEAFTGVCLYGTVSAHFEPEYRELLWNPGDEKYYPGGVTDPDYCVLEFVADSARYYRADGKGTLTKSELAAFDAGKTYENGYAKTHAD